MTKTETARTAAIYSRISHDPNSQDPARRSESPDRQVQACEQFCQARGWTVDKIYVDRDLSAWDKNIERPAFEEVLAAARDKKVTAIVFWKLDRFTRRVSELATLAQELNELGVALVSVNDSIDTSSPHGRLFAHIVSALAEMESETISLRRKAKFQYDAERGRYQKSGRRAFGRLHDGSIVPEEADATREVCRRLLDGESIASLSRWLNEMGHRTPGGNPDAPRGSKGQWTPSTLSGHLRESHLRGVRRHVVGHEKGESVDNKPKRQVSRPIFEEFPGNFEPIIDEWTAVKVADLLKGNERSPRLGRTHLLGGLVFCGKCGMLMGYGAWKSPHDGNLPRYTCRSAQGHGRCGKVSVMQKNADAVVIESLKARLAEPEADDGGDLDQLMIDQEHLWEEDSEAVAALYRERYLDHTVPEEVYFSLRATLQARMEETNESIRHLKQRLAGREDVAPIEWDSLTTPQRKALVQRMVSRVTIDPAARQGPVFDTSRVKIAWADEVDQAEVAT